MTQGLMTVASALAAGTLSVLLAVALIRLWDRRHGGRLRGTDLDIGLQPMVFLFRNRRLVDATEPARAILATITGLDDDWQRLTAWISARLPGLAEGMAGLDRTGRVELSGTDANGQGRLRLVAEDLGNDLLRLTLTDPLAESSGVFVDSLALQAMEEELDLLRNSMDQTPMLAWRQDADERITWANAAYLQRAEGLADGQVAWPLPRLLDVAITRPAVAGQGRRAPLDIDGHVHWYDCHSHRHGDQTMMFALPADAAVRAERSLREFVQTLTKTFADLPIGLAIFDRDRNLQLFNPALIDLTGLPTGFLTARPTLFDFLDQLREARMVPEPKDFRSWRQQMNNLESAAATGHHVETWSLPGGQTYRVTGRPHPDGAVAFLFEDITSEVSMTRKFRAELMLGKHALDGIEDALAVFGLNGKMLMSNDAYDRLWGARSDTAGQAIDLWESRIEAPGAGFAALRRRLIEGIADDTRDRGAMTGPDGGLLSWTVAGLGAGRVMVQFRPPEPVRAVAAQVADPAAVTRAEPPGDAPDAVATDGRAREKTAERQAKAAAG